MTESPTSPTRSSTRSSKEHSRRLKSLNHHMVGTEHRPMAHPRGEHGTSTNVMERFGTSVTRTPATVRICGTIVSPAGKPTHRQGHPKTSRSTARSRCRASPQRYCVSGSWSLPPRTSSIWSLAKGPCRGRHPGRHSALLPPCCRHGHRQRRGRRPGRRDARAHIVGDHQAALHRAGRDGEPGDRRDPRGLGPQAAGRAWGNPNLSAARLAAGWPSRSPAGGHERTLRASLRVSGFAGHYADPALCRHRHLGSRVFRNHWPPHGKRTAQRSGREFVGYSNGVGSGCIT
jgi:hypothetical protein